VRCRQEGAEGGEGRHGWEVRGAGALGVGRDGWENGEDAGTPGGWAYL
jgi:hypothetical protein